MRAILLLVLLIYSHLAYAQLSDDSLQHICTNKYKKDFPNGRVAYWQEQLDKGNIFTETHELFGGCFSQVRIFLIDYDRDRIDLSGFYHSGPGGYPKIYAVNANTGLLVTFKEDTAFFNFVNTANKGIIGLDKCYLYLLLNQLESTGITKPEQYRQVIRFNSIFLQHADVFTNIRPMNCYREKGDSISLYVNYDISNSDKWNIKIPVAKIIDSIEYIYRYSFFFGRKSRLVRVEKKVLLTRPYLPCTNG